VSTSARALALLLLTAGCGEAEQGQPKQAAPRPAPAMVRPQARLPPEPEVAEPVSLKEGGAADVLKLYYEHISARRYEAARVLRDPEGRQASAAEFAANFERYSEHHATVGTPSLVAEAGEWLYVEVPVQRYGKFRDGKTSANAGTVTLRRRKSGGEWRIFTRG
jgi:ketosteroid isomerase-like protein